MSSSRRTSGEIHILAMLDGKTAGPLSRRFLALPAIFWYGAAGVTVCVLLAALAWLVRTPATPPARDTGNAALPSAPPTPLPPQSSADSVPARGAATAPDGDPTDSATLIVTTASAGAGTDTAATIVDLAAPPPSTPAAPTPERMPAPAMPTPNTHRPHIPAATELAQASRHAANTAEPVRPAPASASRALPHAMAPKSMAPRSSGGTTRGGPSAATLGPRDAVRARSRHAPNAQRTAAPAPVDTDVALISAIIQHTNPHGDTVDGGAASACQDRSCGPRMPNRQ